MKIGIVGYGSIGKRHAENAEKLGHDVIIYDPVLANGFERQVYDKADAVVIASPSAFHEAGLRACVERGKHALVEKPLGLAIGALPQLLSTAQAKRLVVMMGNNLRFHPCVQKAKEWLNAGSLGHELYAHFVCTQKSLHPLYRSDGVILNSGAHEVDLATFLLGHAECSYAQADDAVADFFLEHRGGARSCVHLDFINPYPLRNFTIIGDKGTIHCDLIRRLVSRENGDDFVVGPGSWADDYFAEMKAFVDRIEGKETPGADGRDGLDTLSLLLDIRFKAGL